MATTQPTMMPMSGDQRRHAGDARKIRAATVPSVATAATGAAADAVPSGTCVSASNTSGITVTAISMITVPDTTGVKMRRNSGRRAASKKLKQRGDHDEARHRRRTAVYQRRNADGNEGPRRPHEEHVPGAESPHPDCLENGGCAADEQRRKNGPRQVARGLVRNLNHDDDRQYDRRQHDQGGLKTSAAG